MKLNMLVAAAVALGASGCGGSEKDANLAGNAVSAAAADGGAEANALANDFESASPSNPKSPAAAKAVVADYAALAEKGQFTQAAKYWTNATAAAQFASTLEDYPKVKMTAGEPSDEEGAMGSIFITVPLTLDLTLRSGSPYQMTCKAAVRRVNDVPGSSAEQRRWHIESIDC